MSRVSIPVFALCLAIFGAAEMTDIGRDNALSVYSGSVQLMFVGASLLIGWMVKLNIKGKKPWDDIL